jgi:hypothetical protein
MAGNGPGIDKTDLSRAFFPGRREQAAGDPDALDWKQLSFAAPAAPQDPKNPPTDHRRAGHVPLPKSLESKIFNVPKPGARRPEHHRPTPPAVQSKPPPPKGGHVYSGDASFRPINININDDIVRTMRDLAGPRDSDDEFDPNAAIKDHAFGAPDPFQWIDPQKANESIKALLEGAFDEEDAEGGGKRRRLPRRAKKAPEPARAEPKSMAERLKAVEAAEAKPEDAKPEAEDDEEDGVVDGLKVKLLPHQIEGVGWMIDKETKKKKGGMLPKGGILADDVRCYHVSKPKLTYAQMGLGKTIQSLSLILTNPRPTNEELENDKKTRVSKESSKATLVVAPLALIRQWEAEIKTKSEGLTVRIHHGASRTKSAAMLKSNDVVITTYQTLTSEYAAAGSDIGPNAGCFGVYWYRIILDEGHTQVSRQGQDER